MPDAPLILWFRRDLRLDDHPMLSAAVATGRPLVPVFILDPETEAQGAAPLWRLGLSVAALAAQLEGIGSRLILRRGPALATLERLVTETGATGVHWSRLYDPVSRQRDSVVKSSLKARGLDAVSHPGHVLFEPWTVETGQGGFYRVFTPFWRAVKERDVPPPAAAPKSIAAPESWPASDSLSDWRLDARMNRGAAVVAPFQAVGEGAALARLDSFLAGPVGRYATARDLVAEAGTSRLSENLTYGEIGVRRIWAGGQRALHEGMAGAETFLKEIAWREFAYHLVYHTPHIVERNWRDEWDSFPWRADNPDAERWRRGMTGVPFVDAAMREMYVTGTMHNRARMIAASYLTKHLMTHWTVGLDWFAECLTDWDPASNAMGWQWAAGSGPDAAPYFRIFNPETQAEKFDPKAEYRRRFIAELSDKPPSEALAFFDAVPRSWALDPRAPYPEPAVSLAEGRARALAAYSARNS
jgi:deoxyribodipyrimidine photo-lyase